MLICVWCGVVFVWGIAHAIQCMLFGITAIILPHSFFSIRRFGNSYNAVAHEFMRMYGALLLAIGESLPLRVSLAQVYVVCDYL